MQGYDYPVSKLPPFGESVMNTNRFAHGRHVFGIAIVILATTYAAASAQGQGPRTKAFRSPIVSAGSVSGTISWNKGQVPVTLGSRGIPGKIFGVKDVISLSVMPPPRKPFDTQFGKIAVSGTKVSVPYTITGLPVGAPLTIEVKTKQTVNGHFDRDGHGQPISRTAAPTRESPVTNFDFYFVEVPR